ncbi:hypothetical protein CVT24_000482 [Panaeolus cyanescens]|uniref:GP-PDE domain-containing protein n=1 Tax=Panaeolus cyanescens TaxID=181874 RepID=A0A409V8D8_9AGAR|nr:hypothetical protein CVT24_000482 [Panaeolus cyanescens]
MFITSAYFLSHVALALAAPTQSLLGSSQVFDVQGHRGGRGEVVESTLPAFAWGMIDGVTTLELDNGLTKDGAVIVWHDEEISSEKCRDTKPAFKNDPLFPYIGKHVANLTLAQIKTLDCGSNRLSGYPLQTSYPGTKISTLGELFEFARCVDTGRRLLWNVESKINPVDTNSTRSPEDFVKAQHREFVRSGYKLPQITYQSFDWRSIIQMKALEPRILTAALIDSTTVYGDDGGPSVWLGGVDVAKFPGTTTGQKIANAAKSIKADILSPAAVDDSSTAPDPTQAGYVPFTTKDMIEQAHKNGLVVAPWTVNRMNIAEQLLQWGVDGIITDYPDLMRRFIEQKGRAVAPEFPKDRVLKCLNRHIQRV